MTADLGKRILDGVVGPETNPLGDRTVLALGLAHLLLGAETLVALGELELLAWLFHSPGPIYRSC